MAARMKTSRRQLDRLFDPSIPSVTLDTVRRAANAVGRSLRIEWCEAGASVDFGRHGSCALRSRGVAAAL